MDNTNEEALHIFLIDDDTFLLDMYSTKFREVGYQVTTAPKADSALSELRQGFAPDIILLDIIMPEMSGLDFLHAMRDEGLVPDAAVIMLTNQGREESIEYATNMNADGYIVKATSVPSEVLDEVERIYEETRA